MNKTYLFFFVLTTSLNIMDASEHDNSVSDSRVDPCPLYLQNPTRARSPLQPGQATTQQQFSPYEEPQCSTATFEKSIASIATTSSGDDNYPYDPSSRRRLDISLLIEPESSATLLPSLHIKPSQRSPVTPASVENYMEIEGVSLSPCNSDSEEDRPTHEFESPYDMFAAALRIATVISQHPQMPQRRFIKNFTHRSSTARMALYKTMLARTSPKEALLCNHFEDVSCFNGCIENDLAARLYDRKQK